MGIVEFDVPAMEHLIHRLSEVEGKLGPLVDDTYTTGYQFLGTFLAPQKQQVEEEFNQLITDLRSARDYNHALLDLLQRILIDLQDPQHIIYRP